MNTRLLILLMIAFAFSKSSAQNAGTLDTSFNSTGILILQPGNQHDVMYSVKIQPDGKSIYCGVGRVVNTSGSNFDMVVGRRNIDGSVDTTFGTNGVVVKDFGVGSDFAYRMTLQPDGKILVVGGYSVTANNTDWAIIRLMPDGTYDTTFNSTGIVQISLGSSEDYAYDVVVQPDNKILVGGVTKVPGFVYYHGAFVRLNPDGSFDTGFGTNGITIMQPAQPSWSQTFKNIELLPGGNIVAGGWSYQNNVNHLLLAGFNSNGVLNPAFGTNGVYINNAGIEQAFDIVINNNLLFAGGTSSNANGSSLTLTQFDTTGVINPFFGANGTVFANYNPINACYGLILQPDNKIVAAGTSGQGAFGDRDLLAVRFFQNGVVDSTFGINGKTILPIGPSWDDANAIALQTDGKIILGGASTFTNNDMLMIRLLNDSGAVTSVLQPPIENISAYTLMPNPFSNYFDIKFNKKVIEGTVEIINTLGAGVFKANIYLGQDKIRITTDKISTGIYFVKVYDGKNVFTQKLIKN